MKDHSEDRKRGTNIHEGFIAESGSALAYRRVQSTPVLGLFELRVAGIVEMYGKNSREETRVH